MSDTPRTDAAIDFSFSGFVGVNFCRGLERELASSQKECAERKDREINDALNILRLIDTIKYLCGIAERGEGRVLREDETPESFVLGYVKRKELECAELRKQNEELHSIVNEQAEDAGIWFVAEHATEDYMQAALRRLHKAIEERSHE